MAAQLWCLEELLDSGSDDEEMCCLLGLCVRESHRKVENYMEDVAPRMSQAHFRHTFRVPRSVFQYMLDTLHVDDTNNHIGGREAITAEKKIGMFLRYAGSKSTVFEVAQLFNVSEASFIKARRQVVSSILDTMLPQHVAWPLPNEMDYIAQAIESTGNNFPGIIGLLDGTHIPIWRPHTHNPDSYYNRKKYFSVNVQAVCREDLRLTYVSVGNPGRMHDARALRSCTLWDSGYLKCQQGRYHLLGDAAYPLSAWLLTPYRNTGNLTPAQLLYNQVHSTKHQMIERCFGLLKKRFPVLRHTIEIVDMQEINQLILATCVIHNVCILYQDNLDFPDDEDNDDVPQPANIVVPNAAALGVQGRLKRLTITNMLQGGEVNTLYSDTNFTTT